MITKGRLPALSLEGRDTPALIEAYFELNHLKQLYRQGWLRRGLPAERCESVAEHIFGMAMLAWWIADTTFPELDRDKVLRMILLHELGEIYIGDIVPADGVAAEEKNRLEREGFQRVVGKLPRGAEYLTLWEEFEQGETAEARFTRQLDRLEMAFQAAVYEHQTGLPVDEFFATTSAALADSRLREIFEQLQEIRKRQ